MPLMLSEDSSVDYDVQGKGPPLLLIAGLGFGRWCWFKQMPTLSRHFRVITFDLRSLSRLDLLDVKDRDHSIADLVAPASSLLDHLGVERAHVLGTSLGGFVAQELALQRPELVDRLVLVCTSYGGPDSEPMSWEALRAMLGLGAKDRADAARQGLEAATSEDYRRDYPEEFAQVLQWRIVDAPSQTSYLEQMMTGARFDVSCHVHTIQSPTLVLHGGGDRVVPVDNGVALARAIPDAKLRVFEDAGHLVFIERAEELNEEIVSFLKQGLSQKATPPPAREREERSIMSMVDEQQRRLVTEAARKFADAISESYRTADARAASAYAADPSQEPGAELVQRFFDDVINELSTQAEGIWETTQELMDQQRRQQETMRALVRESVDAYMNLINSMFSFYRGAEDEAGRNAGNN
jgi:pimeloyl-ACP methyl ester carboxylesterase